MGTAERTIVGLWVGFSVGDFDNDANAISTNN